MQSLKLRLPDHDEFKGSKLKSSKVESFKKVVQKSIASSRDRHQKERLRFGELMESGKDSSVSSSSSSSFSIPRKDRGLDSSLDSMFDSGSCCRKGNVAGILLQDHEENKGIAIPREEMQLDTQKCPREMTTSSNLHRRCVALIRHHLGRLMVEKSIEIQHGRTRPWFG
ncbi:uncharacterized protein LOC142529467 [Primulina tabacum]|uniref:uncharacterized protein LOC142529467 n=1 Tax=Primulina tabacum TaxID=48773 RepID=UPI003F5A4B65